MELLGRIVCTLLVLAGAVWIVLTMDWTRRRAKQEFADWDPEGWALWWGSALGATVAIMVALVCIAVIWTSP